MQQSATSSRKRTAAGGSPMIAQAQQPYVTSQPSHQTTSTQHSGAYPIWPQDEFGLGLLASYEANHFNQVNYPASLKPESDASLQTDPQALQSNGQLVRRNTNQQLTRQANTWDHHSAAQPLPRPDDDENEEQIEQRALEAKKETIARKGSIPPFVQKLGSFLDDPKNLDLIKWSDDARSFIVLDEDEFARTLIPELFKHKNYASFVRQLNMYGFHKKVGLTDNSMKASETKRKTPSEYFHPYFRRGRSDLFWLIKKPKSTATKKSQDSKPDEDDAAAKPRPPLPPTLPPPHTPSSASPKPRLPSQELQSIPPNDWETMRDEVVQLKKQNQLISNVIHSLKNQSSMIHQQAAQFQQAQKEFQEKNERHEKSINAILTFLATFYNRSLEGQTQNLADMFAGKLGANNQSGSIVDMTDMPDLPDLPFDLHNFAGQAFNLPRAKRQLLLPAPQATKPIKSQTPPPRIEHVDDLSSIQPAVPRASLDPNPDIRSEILDIINAANATSPRSSGSLDFDSALAHMQSVDGTTPLTDHQRQDILERLAHDTNTPLDTATPEDMSALPSDDRVHFVTHPRSTPPYTLASPNMASPNTASPNMASLLHRQTSLDIVQMLQQEQAQKVQDLADRLGSFSPNGSIPGIDDSTNPSDFNFDDFLDLPSSQYFPSTNPITTSATTTTTTTNTTDFDPNNPDGLEFADPAIYTAFDLASPTYDSRPPPQFAKEVDLPNVFRPQSVGVSSRGVSPVTLDPDAALNVNTNDMKFDSPRFTKRQRQA